MDVPDEAEEVPPPSTVAPILIKTSFPLGRVARCLSKMALEYICARFGTNVALDQALDRLRRFARHGEGNFSQFVDLAVFDSGLQSAVRAYAHPTRHALVLNQLHNESLFSVVVQIVLYGTAIGVVRVATTEQPLLPLGTWRVSYFDPQQKTFEHYVVPQDGLGCFVNIGAVLPEAEPADVSAEEPKV